MDNSRKKYTSGRDDPYYRRSDPTAMVEDVVDDIVALRPTEALQFDEVRFGRGLINMGRRPR